MVLILLTNVLFAQYTLRVATYNLLGYDDNYRDQYFKTVLDEIEPDVLVVQEMETQSASDNFKSAILGDAYFAPPFNDGPTTDNQLYYNPFEIKFHSANYISTSLRDIAEYKLEIASLEEVFYIYSVHLKASSGSDNEQQRFSEASVLREHLNEHPEGTAFIVAGDFNVYSSQEPAYQKLTGFESDNDGRLYDPLNRPGSWHNNSNFASIHTQSTRTTSFGDGSTGGMDDRFDMILVSDYLSDIVEPQTYQAFGNDGNHFNTSIVNGSNSVVSEEVANALHQASDHLPVYCDFVFGATTIAESAEEETIGNFYLYQNYPNPFNPETKITFALNQGDEIRLTVYNPAGETVARLAQGYYHAGTYTVEWNPANRASGVYVYELRSGGYRICRKMILLK